MKIVLDEPQPIEKLRKIYNDKVTFVTSTKSYPLVESIEFSGEYLGAMRKRNVPVKIGKKVDKLIDKYTKRMKSIWDRYRREISRIVQAEDLPETVEKQEDNKEEEKDRVSLAILAIPTLAQVRAEKDSTRRKLLMARYLKAKKNEILKPKLEEMKEELKGAAKPLFEDAYKLGKQRGQIMTDQEISDDLSDVDREILEEKENWNELFLAVLVGDAFSDYEKALEAEYESPEKLFQAVEEAHNKESYRLPKFAAALGSVLLAAGTGQAIKDVQEIDPETGEPTGEPKLDRETGLPVGVVLMGGYWHTRHDDGVCEGCENNDAKWMTITQFRMEAGTNQCRSNCRCIELWEPAPLPDSLSDFWNGQPGLDKFVESPSLVKRESIDQSKVVAIDLDGTILQITDDINVLGDPISGASEVVAKLKEEGYTIIIHTVRGNRKDIADHLKYHGIIYDYINYNPRQPVGANPGKPLAAAYVDDKAVRFDGDWKATYEELKQHLNSVHKADTKARIEEAASEVEIPTENQKENGNYKKGHVHIHGLDISIENPKGSVRSGIDRNGNKWSTKLNNHYGYIKQTEGGDKEQVDVFLGSDLESEKVFVIDQIKPDTGQFDEHKVLLGFKDAKAAREGYLSNYDKGWQGLGALSEMDIKPFKDWVYSRDAKKPVAHELIKAEFREEEHLRDESGKFTSGGGGGADIGEDTPETSVPQKLETFEGIKEHLSTGTRLIMSGERGNLRPEENYRRSIAAKRVLQNLSDDLVMQEGQYGTKERSYIATPKSDVDLDAAVDFALSPSEGNQESVIVMRDGIAEMRYADKRPSEYAKVSEMKEAPEAADFYSKLGNTKYQLDFKYKEKPSR